jgi:hypothetical protein
MRDTRQHRDVSQQSIGQIDRSYLYWRRHNVPTLSSLVLKAEVEENKCESVKAQWLSRFACAGWMNRTNAFTGLIILHVYAKMKSFHA